jgi:hypothetical protein
MIALASGFNIYAQMEDFEASSPAASAVKANKPSL